MKKVHFISAWTDYPFVELGDDPGEQAPIRRVNLLDYDGGAYATVAFDDNSFHLQVKIGYLYRHRQRLSFKTKQKNPAKIARAFGFRPYYTPRIRRHA